jgi:hypothetical protein
MFSMILRDYAKSCVNIDDYAAFNLFSFLTVTHENERKRTFSFPLLPVTDGGVAGTAQDRLW